MAVSWIKLSVDMMDNKKIKIIENMPNGDSMILIWIWLLSIAGETNDEGFIYLTEGVPYTAEMLASQFRKPVELTKQALEVFEQFSMIQYVDDCLKIKNWEKYQNIGGLDKVRDQNKERVRNWRKRQKEKDCSNESESNVTCNGDVTEDNITCNIADNVTSNDDITLYNVTRNVTGNDDITLRNVTRNVTRNGDVTQCNALDIELDIDKESKKVSKNLFIYSENEKYKSFDDEDKNYKRVPWNNLIDNSNFDIEVKELLKSKWLPYKSQCLKASNSKLSNDAVSFCLDDLAELSSDKEEQMKIIKKAIQSGDYSFSDLKTKPSKTSRISSKDDHSSEKASNQINFVGSANDEVNSLDESYHCDLDKEEFYDFATNGKKSDEEWDEYYDKEPVAFLESKQKHPVAKATKRLLRDLQKNYNIGNGAINVLVEYILAFKNQRLQRAYVETIASEWAREGVCDVKSARKMGRNILASIRAEVLNSYFPPETDEGVNSGYHIRSSDESEEMA